jgi:hypothetical protein
VGIGKGVGVGEGKVVGVGVDVGKGVRVGMGVEVFFGLPPQAASRLRISTMDTVKTSFGFIWAS